MKKSTLPKKKGNIQERKLGDECLVYDVDSGRVHHLNSTATFIWEKFDECFSKEDLVLDLKKCFPLQPMESLESDVNSVIDSFMDIHLMEERE